MSVQNSNPQTAELPKARTNWHSSRGARAPVAPPKSRLRVAAFVTLGLLLLWGVLTRSLVAYLADTTPDVAVPLPSTNSTALLNLAQDKLNLDPGLNKLEPIDAPLVSQEISVAKGIQGLPQTQSGDLPQSADGPVQDVAQIHSWAERALLNDPLNARAFRILGQLLQSTSGVAQTATLMQAAASRSLLETLAVYWVMRKNYQDGDYRSAIRYADALLRSRPQFPQLSLPLFGKIAETPEASGELKQLLAANPRWRSQFFTSLPDNISDARTPLDILLALKDTPAPPTNAELKPYLQFLTDHEFYELAYYTWLQFLPQDQLSRVGNLFNGNFEVPPSGLPFDWIFTAGSGVTIGIANRADREGEHALFIEFGAGRVEDLSVSEIVMLPPGNYQFRGSYKADIVSQRGLQWRVVCANKTKTVIGESSTVIGAEAGWKDLGFALNVPDADCPAQSVQLAFNARSASEQFVSGSVWFDDLQILREASLQQGSEGSDTMHSSAPENEPSSR